MGSSKTYWDEISPITEKYITLFSKGITEFSNKQLKTIFTTKDGMSVVRKILEKYGKLYRVERMEQFAEQPLHPTFIDNCRSDRLCRLIFILSSACNAVQNDKMFILTDLGSKLINAALGAGSVDSLVELVDSYSIPYEVLEMCFDKSPTELAEMTFCYAAIKGKIISDHQVLWRELRTVEVTCNSANLNIILNGSYGLYDDKNNSDVDQRRMLLLYYADAHIAYDALKKTKLSDTRVYDFVKSLHKTWSYRDRVKVYGNAAKVLKINDTQLMRVYTGKYYGLYIMETKDGTDTMYKLTSALDLPTRMEDTAASTAGANLSVTLDKYIDKFGGTWDTDHIIRLLSLCHVDLDEINKVVESIMD